MAIFTILFEIFFLGLYGMFVLNYLRGKKFIEMMNLISATIFGYVLEILVILRYEGYRYSTKFLVQIGEVPSNVPIVIACSWGMIIVSSMYFSDRLGINKWLRPLLDTLQALTIDLTMDVVAIRIEGGFWIWGIPLTNTFSQFSYFGVLWGNFIAWYLVILVFSYFIRFSRKLWGTKISVLRLLYSLLSPIIAFIPFYFAMEAIRLSHYYYWYFTGDIIEYYFAKLIGFIIFCTLFIVIREIRGGRYNVTKENEDKLPLILFITFHVFYGLAFIFLGLIFKLPLASMVSIIAILSNVYFHYWMRKKNSQK